MKKSLLIKRFFSVVTLSLFALGAMAAGTKYCGEVLENGGKQVTITCEPVSGILTMTIEGSDFVGLGGTFFHPDGATGAVDIRNRISSSEGSKIVITFDQAGDTNPQLYTPLYVLMPGEVSFNVSVIDWSDTCAPATDPFISVTPKSLIFTEATTQYIYVSGENLTDNIFIVSQSPYFGVVPTSISPDAIFPVEITVVCTAVGEDPVEGSILLSSTGATDKEVEVQYSVNTNCKGFSKESTQGPELEKGYNYNFSTDGTTVTFEFELLDEKEGLVMYLWDQTTGGVVEHMMTMTPGSRKGTYSMTDQTIGEDLIIACKFAYAGNMAVTKQFTYTVGDNCTPTEVIETAEESNVYVAGGIIYADGAPAAEILNLLGQQVNYPLASGVYLVNTSKGFVKINY